MHDTVLVILDGEFGDRLQRVPAVAIWLVDSATNLAAWEARRRADPGFTVTTFRDTDASPPEQFAALLPAIALHHGPHSQDPPFSRLEVIGIRPNHVVRHALDEVDFTVTELRPDGFVARRWLWPEGALWLQVATPHS